MAHIATPSPTEKLSMFALAFGALALIVGAAFALGWLFGRIVL
jgi:hypothetical protein